MLHWGKYPFPIFGVSFQMKKIPLVWYSLNFVHPSTLSFPEEEKLHDLIGQYEKRKLACNTGPLFPPSAPTLSRQPEKKITSVLPCPMFFRDWLHVRKPREVQHCEQGFTIFCSSIKTTFSTISLICTKCVISQEAI